LSIQSRIERALIDELKVIDMLSTHPEHQHRGAGSMLVKWGADIADRFGLKAFVQGSRLGKHLYERYGFVDKEGWVTVPVTERHKNKPAVGWFNLERPAIPLDKDAI
jgi:GNAT superfamily N-acetyltransferase